MFITKYSLLRRIISLTVASLMILAFTPGIAVIADPDDPLQITSPAENSLVRNPVSLQGGAIIPQAEEGGWHIAIVWDWNEQITQPDDTIDINIPSDASYPYTANWSKDHNYPIGSDGNKTIKVWLYSGPAFNILALSEIRTIKVDNTLPQVNLTSPQNNAAVSNKEGYVEVSAKAKDVNEIDFLDFYILDHETLSETDTPKWSDVEPSSEPDAEGWYAYSRNWNTLQEDIGTWYVTIVAVDKAGNTGRVTNKVFVTRYGEEAVGPAGTGTTPVEIPGDSPAEQEQVELIVPQDALTEQKTLTLEVVPISLPGMPTPPEGYFALPRAYRFGPSPLNFPPNKEVTLTFRYTNDELQGKDESKLGVYYYDSSKGWVYQTDTDTANNTITIKVNHFSDFGLFIDTVAPKVTSTSPEKDATKVAVISSIKATFSEDINKDSISPDTFILKKGTASVGGEVSYDSTTRTATFKPSSNLAYSAEYTATIKGGATGVKDQFGNNMQNDYSWKFTTSAQPPSAPTNLTATPGDGVINLFWNAVSGATGYKVYWGTTSAYGNEENVGNVITYQITGLTNGVPYYIAVSAYNAAGDESSKSTATATPKGNYGLTITKTVDKANASPNDTLTYTLTYKNTGNSGLTNVQLTDPIPSGTTYETNSANAGTYNSTTNSISLTVASLAAGSEGTLSFKVTVVPTAAGIIVNTASIKSTEITPAMTDSASTTIGVATTVVATGGDATAAGTTGPATTAAATTAAAAGAAKKLPRTGMELLQYLFIAMLLITSGLGLQFVGRREEM